MSTKELEAQIERLSDAVRKMAGWNGTDISELIDEGIIWEEDVG